MTRPTSEQILRVFGRNIEVMAVNHGITLTNLAAELQITADTLSRVRRRSARYIDPEILLGCARIFGCTTDELLNPINGVKY